MGILDKFLEFKDADGDTKKAGVFAFLLITSMLAFLSISGAIAMSEGDDFKWIIRIVFALLIAGAEILAAVIFVRAILAGSKLRMIVCLLIWGGLAWTCVQNAKEGAHAIFSSRFELSSSELTAQAQIAGEDATSVGAVRTSAIENAPKELERVRTQIAELEVFSRKMTAMSPEGIMEAQTEMIPRCGYAGRVDGIRSTLTEAAMRSCGEKIGRELETLKSRENSLASGQYVAAPLTTAPGDDPRLKEAALKAAADKAWWDGFKLEIMLWVLEAARSLGLWAAFTNVTASNVSRVKSREDELAEAEHQAKLAAIRAAMAPTPPPVAVEPSPAPIPPPEPEPAPAATPEPIAALEPDPLPEPEPIVLVDPVPEMTDQQRAARQGGLAAQHERRAAKTERLLVIGPTTTIGAEQIKVAAQ